MVYVKAGTFIMGSPESEEDRSDNEIQHKVTISKDFYIGKYEVTQREYKAVMGTNPSKYKGDNRPVETVSWYNAVEYCNKLSEKEGLTKAYTIDGTTVTLNNNATGYRLPTEAQWEYAARGGNKSQGYKYSGSDTVDSVAWHSGNSDSSTHNVGTKAANELGIYDMSGNVYEWCYDWYDDYSSGSVTDPEGSSTGSYRVFRGGIWRYDSGYCRVAFRHSGYPSFSYHLIGFRLLLPAQ